MSHADILDQRESLRMPFAGSVVFHAMVLSAFFLFSVRFDHSRENWGARLKGAGSAVAINPVNSIPLPAHAGPVNPVANDTKSHLPQAPKPEVQKHTPPPPEKAIPLKNRYVPPTPVREMTSTQRYHPPTPYRPNQVYTPQAPATSSPMFAKAGAGAVGVTPNSLLGSRFGAYANLLMERVAQRWHTGGLEGVRAPFVIVSVDILRNGTIRNPQLVQRSGNTTLDYSALRAVTEAAPFPPLPPEYERDVVNVEFQFQIQR